MVMSSADSDMRDSSVMGTPLISPVSSPATSTTSSGRTSHDSDVENQMNPPLCRTHCKKSVAVLSGHAGTVSCLTICGEFVITASRGDDIIVWQQPDLREFARFGYGDGAVKAVFSSGNRVFTAHQDGRIRVWRVTRDSQNVFKLVTALPTAKDYLGKFLNQRNYIQTRRHHKRLWIEHSDSISCLEVSNGLIYSGSWDKTLKVWRLSDFKCLESINAHTDAINCLVSRKGTLYSSSADGTIKAWCRDKITKTHQLKATMMGHKDVSLNSLVVSDDGKSVYAGGSDGCVIGWRANDEFETYTIFVEMKTHTMSVLCMCLMGDFLCCGSADKSISVWKLDENENCLKEHMVMRGHEGAVKCLQGMRARGGFMLYSGSIDKTVRVWWIPISIA